MDDRVPESSHDFGKDVIPMLLEENKKLFAYPFKGYWKDVGTVQSLWEANMDLLREECDLDLFDHGWRIYSVNPNQPPQYISPAAVVKESLINEGCTIEGDSRKIRSFSRGYGWKRIYYLRVCHYAGCYHRQ